MKIFYAVQATGNGHISRAMELLPFLRKYGNVDVFLSGSNASLSSDLPIIERHKGLSLFYTQKGALNWIKTAKHIGITDLYKTAKSLPLENYDLIINDFEAICAFACFLKERPSVHFGHQASFASPHTPRPKHKSITGELVLKNFAKSSTNIGLHFSAYDDFILPPVIKSEIWNATPKNNGHISVYLPSYADKQIIPYFLPFKNVKFEIFSKETKVKYTTQNCSFIPINKNDFNHSLIHCNGIITNAGFETPAEAMYLNKKLLAIPINGQYEQACNAAAMQLLGISTIPKIEANFTSVINQWLENSIVKYDNSHFINTEIIVEKMMTMAKDNGALNNRKPN